MSRTPHSASITSSAQRGHLKRNQHRKSEAALLQDVSRDPWLFSAASARPPQLPPLPHEPSFRGSLAVFPQSNSLLSSSFSHLEDTVRRERERAGTGFLFEEPNPTGSRPSDLIGLCRKWQSASRRETTTGEKEQQGRGGGRQGLFHFPSPTPSMSHRGIFIKTHLSLSLLSHFKPTALSFVDSQLRVSNVAFPVCPHRESVSGRWGYSTSSRNGNRHF